MVYSIDLRKRALNDIANGGSRSEASKIFGVTIPTLANWLSRPEFGVYLIACQLDKLQIHVIN